MVMLTRCLLWSFVPRTVERAYRSSLGCQEARTRRFRKPLRRHGLRPKWRSTSGRNPAVNCLSYCTEWGKSSKDWCLPNWSPSNVLISNRMIASTMLHVNLCNGFTLTTIWILRTGSDEEMMKFRCRNCIWCWSFIFEVSCATLRPIRKSQNLGDRFASRPWRKLEEQSGCLKKMMEKGALNSPKSLISGKTANTSKWWWILRWISRMRTVLDVKTGHYPQAWFAASVAPWGSAMTQATGAK